MNGTILISNEKAPAWVVQHGVEAYRLRLRAAAL